MADKRITEQDALYYHEVPTSGKVAIKATKPLNSQRDLSLAYSPGVSHACKAIQQDPRNSFKYTSKGNLVGVISNGTAVLGLGNIGADAAKPVMEGKAVLFKKFANIDAFDIEINEQDPQRLVDIIASLEPTFGGINLEDIKAPECFEIEKRLRERMKIPVFHDDQHGTAITVSSALINGLEVVGKRIDQIKLVCSGAGAAALCCLDLLVDLGLPLENIWVADIEGVVYQGRTTLMDEQKVRFAQATDKRTLIEIIDQADVFLGLSAGKVLKPEMLQKMAKDPLVLALANPEPEILPELALQTRSDVVIATGRSDYPNQVNNVLCFPYIFRGALDVEATTITRNMEKAAVYAIVNLAKEEQDEKVASAYGSQQESFGKGNFIPTPFDPRLLSRIAPAVAKAAMQDGVANKPIKDFDDYITHLQTFTYHSGGFMGPLFNEAREWGRTHGKNRIVFAEGEEERVLRAVQVILYEKLAYPILIGRPHVIQAQIDKFGLKIQQGTDITVVNPEEYDLYSDFCMAYWKKRSRQGVTKAVAEMDMRRQNTLIGAMLVEQKQADGMICGTVGGFHTHLKYVDAISARSTCPNSTYAAMSILLLENYALAIADTHINENPNAEQIADITILAAKKLQNLNIVPKVALVARSAFGADDCTSGGKLRQALALIKQRMPELEVDGEMHADCAIDGVLRKKLQPDSFLEGSANLLICPNVDAGNIAYNLLKTVAGHNVAVGPFLLGCHLPINIMTTNSTIRRIVNMTALTVIDANCRVDS